MSVEIPNYVVDRDALIQLADTDIHSDPNAMMRLRHSEFVDTAFQITPKGKTAALECKRRREISPFTGLPR